MAVKTKTKEVSMEEALWKSADKLRVSVEPSEYKHAVLRGNANVQKSNLIL